MCGRYIILTEEENIEIRAIINEINKHFRHSHLKASTGEIYPTNICPVIKSCGVCLVNWGFPKRSGGVVINARMETVHQKPFFAKPLLNNRCLIPASGFFEWKKQDKKKIKHLVRHGNIIYMAGLYSPFRSLSEKTGEGFVIITTDSKNEMAKLHDRMPVILSEEKRKIWLSDTKDISSIRDILDNPVEDFEITLASD